VSGAEQRARGALADERLLDFPGREQPACGELVDPADESVIDPLLDGERPELIERRPGRRRAGRVDEEPELRVNRGTTAA
jgi:hypothetical protein